MIKLIKWPYSRLNIDGCLEELANFEEQNKWLQKNTCGKSPHPYWDWLTYYVVDSLYGEYDWDEYNPEKMLETFYDEHEAKEAYKFATWFDDIIEEIGYDKPDSAYLNHPKWPNVIKRAKEVYDLMQQNNEKYDYGKYLDIFNYEPREQWLKRFESTSPSTPPEL